MAGEASEGTNTAAEEMGVSQMLMREVGALNEQLKEVFNECSRLPACSSNLSA